MIGAFNSLKGILAIMIFVHHLDMYRGGGSLAVAIFFTLGGFLSTLGYKDRVASPDFNYKNYLIGKFIKFYPLHWLLLIAAIPLMFNGGGDLLKGLCVLGINASLLQSWIPIESVYFSGNAVSWYLSDTLAFVVVFPFLLRWMLNGSKTSKIVVTMGILIIYILFWIFLPQEYTHRFFYISPLFRIVDYAVGMAVAILYLQMKDLESVKEYIVNHANLLHLIIWMCFVGLIFFSFANEYFILHSIIYTPLISIMLILIALSGGMILQMSILQKFGSISFAFFLVHQLCIRYLHMIFNKVGYDEIYIVAPVAFIFTTIASYFLTYKFDKKIAIWLKQRLINRRSMIVQ